MTLVKKTAIDTIFPTPFRPPAQTLQSSKMNPEIKIYIDADACPVKAETYKVAARHGLKTFVVSGDIIGVPMDPMIERIIAGAGFDAADDWIAAHAGAHAIVVTADIPLASRCIDAGATVLSPKGREFTENAIGATLATRNLMADLREAGALTGGPAPFSKANRSAYLSTLENLVVRLKRGL